MPWLYKKGGNTAIEEFLFFCHESLKFAASRFKMYEIHADLNALQPLLEKQNSFKLHTNKTIVSIFYT